MHGGGGYPPSGRIPWLGFLNCTCESSFFATAFLNQFSAPLYDLLIDIFNISGPSQNHPTLRSLHCHCLRSLLHLWRRLRLLRLQMLQSHHVPLRLHLRINCCLPHLCRGGGPARLGEKIELFLREAILRQVKDFLWNYFVNGGGVWLISCLNFFNTPFKHPENTLQHHSNTLQIISFFAKKMDKKIKKIGTS